MREQPHVCPSPSYLVDLMKGLMVGAGAIDPQSNEVLGSLGVAELNPDSPGPAATCPMPAMWRLAQLSWILFA